MLVKVNGSSHPTLGGGRFAQVFNRWPAILIVVGLAVTIMWIGFLVWSVLRILQLL